MDIRDKLRDFRATLDNELDICIEGGDGKREDTAMVLYLIKEFEKLFKQEYTEFNDKGKFPKCVKHTINISNSHLCKSYRENKKREDGDG